MAELLVIFVALTVLVLVDAAAVSWGVDSRDESSDPRWPRSSTGIGVS